MLIKNTNPNELLAEFERNENFCPYNEEELERLKKEAERLREDVTCHIGISHNGTWFEYSLSEITDKGVHYKYGKYGSIEKISSRYSEEWMEHVRFVDYGKIVFYYNSKNSDGNTDWTLEVTRMDGRNEVAALWIGDEVKFNKRVLNNE